MKKNTDDKFIMLPIVDFCFKELMQNAKVRQGFIASLLAVKPEMVKETELLPTILPQEHVDDKLGILDVRVKLIDGTQMDFEMQVASFDYWEKRILFYLSRMYTEPLKKGESYEKLQRCIHVSILDFIHFPEDERCYRTISFCDVETGELYSDLMEIKILELKKLQKNVPDNAGPEAMEHSDEECAGYSGVNAPAQSILNSSVYEWMRFFSGKSRKEFDDMAQTDEYIGEACEELKKLSADERKRLEYEAREKALRDYNSQVKSYYDRGHAAGQEEAGGRINSLNLKLAELGRMGDITRAAKDRTYQEELLKEFGL
ncbi:MAG: Rpn family recombination-promoting nuclease/putative transposase [Clostridiales bacterium]|nr:Rpn family recombination-promoting nuclease/putative transposase [Clostridiales bacterium]